MTGAVVAAAVAVAVINAAPACWGAWRWHRAQAPGPFWVMLRVGQVAALALAAGVGVLALVGSHSSDELFYLYALLPVAVGLVAEQLRLSCAQAVLDQRSLPDAQAVGRLPEGEQRRVVEAIVNREMGVMAASALVVIFLAIRAAGTAQGF